MPAKCVHRSDTCSRLISLLHRRRQIQTCSINCNGLCSSAHHAILLAAAAAAETHELADCTIQSMDYLRTHKMQRRSAVDGHGGAEARRIAEQLRRLVDFPRIISRFFLCCFVLFVSVCILIVIDMHTRFTLVPNVSVVLGAFFFSVARTQRTRNAFLILSLSSRLLQPR